LILLFECFYQFQQTGKNPKTWQKCGKNIGASGAVAELAYAADLKSAGETRVGSSPTRPIGTVSVELRMHPQFYRNIKIEL
jgi:hypothetical protein